MCTNDLEGIIKFNNIFGVKEGVPVGVGLVNFETQSLYLWVVFPKYPKFVNICFQVGN